MADAFTCTLVTPEAQVFEETVTSVNLPAHDGQIGVLHGRAPILTELGFGKLELTTEEGETRAYFVGGGFAQVKDNVLTLLTDEALPVEDLEAESAQAALNEALDAPGSTLVERARKDKDVARARAMVGLAR